jgi:hypothetical protein
LSTREKAIFFALFYPFTVAAIAAGFLAFVMLVLKISMAAVSAIVLWFYFICAASIYLMSKQAIERLGMRRLFLGLILTISMLAILSSVLFILEQNGGLGQIILTTNIN